ncbi:unnamed protein product [Cunninghamella echinulata]
MASSILLKKQEELNIRKVRDLLRLPENKKCFDCPTKSPFFVNTTLQTFICSRCSGLVREVGHRVKSISASKFSGQEVVALELGGNGKATKIWLNGFNAQNTPEPETDGDVRAFMRQKYYESKWLNRDLLKHQEQEIKNRIHELFTEDGLPRPVTRRRNTMEHSTQFKLPAPLNLSSSSNLIEPSIKTAPLMNVPQPQPKYSPEQMKRSPVYNQHSSPSSSPQTPNVTSTTSTPSLQSKPQSSPQYSIFSDLAGLSLSNNNNNNNNNTPSSSSKSTSYNSTTATTSTSISQPSPPTNNRRATFTGGLLTPNKIGSPTSPSFSPSNDHQQKRYSVQPTQTLSVPRMTSDTSNHKRTTSLQETDPYTALRELHQQRQQEQEQFTNNLVKVSKIETNQTLPSSDDPYAALRHLTDRQSSTSSSSTSSSSTITTIKPIANLMNTSPKPLYNTSIYPTNNNNINANEISSRVSESSDGSSWQGQSFSTINEDWVEAEPFEPDNDFDNNINTSPIPSKMTAANNKPINNNIFGDLDPLANLKKNKMFSAK